MSITATSTEPPPEADFGSKSIGKNLVRPVRMAVVGLGFGLHIVDNQLICGSGAAWVDLVGVFDLNLELAATVAKARGLVRYESFDEILRDPTIETVGIFTPPQGRAELVREAIRAGKHVMTTKPFERNPVEALDVLEEARALGRTVHMNSPSPLPAPETAQFFAWNREFSLGRPISARWETYVHRVQHADGSWYDDPRRCPAAPLFRLGVYGINQLIRVCGRMERVCVAHSRILTKKPTPDTAEMLVRFESGAIGSVFASFCVDDGIRYGNNLTVHFEHGTIRSESHRTDAHFNKAEHVVKLRTVAADGRLVQREAYFPLEAMTGQYHWGEFHAAVRSNGCLQGEIEPELIAHAVAVIDAMGRSEQSGQWESVEVLACQDSK